MEIRKPDMTELKRILELSPQSLFEGTLGRVKPADEKVRQLVGLILEKGGCYFIAVEEDQLAGWVLVGSSQDPFTEKKIGFIYELYVIPAHRGKGFSKHLMENAIQHLKSEGYPEIRLNVFCGNGAIQLYKQLGFTERNITMSLKLE
jgi:ribosomal protein S18 acetylase RimI-like enzyme